MEFTETAEEPVVSRRARVVEEVTVHQDVEEHTETVRGTVRRTVVDVDQDAEARPETEQTARPGTSPPMLPTGNSITGPLF